MLIFDESNLATDIKISFIKIRLISKTVKNFVVKITKK